MESFKPILTQEELKKECRKARNLYDTPLLQTRKAIKNIQKKSSKRPELITREEWQDLPCNKKYMKIANEYHQRKLRQSKREN